MERGTLFQLRNLINRRNVTKRPKKDVNASEDFLEVIVTGHILTAVMSCLGMSSLNDMPLSSVLSHDMWMQDDEVRRKILREIASHVVNQHVDLAVLFKKPPAKKKASVVKETPGTAYDYACEVLTLGLFIMDFKDAVREGDGEHMMLLWKFMLLIFKASGRKNYALEALTLLTQYYLTLPPNLAEQLKWSRFVNVHGRPGCNISCDLHMEHINKLVKGAIDGLGANKSEKAIKRVAKAIGVLSTTTECYDSEVGLVEPSGKHSHKSMCKDLNKIVEQLQECKTFNIHTKTTHMSFSNLKKNILRTLDEKELKEWMIQRFSILLQPGSTAAHEEDLDKEGDSENEGDCDN